MFKYVKLLFIMQFIISFLSKEKTALQKSCLDYYFLVLVALLILDDVKTLL